jgi:hypothetical protein
MEAAKGLAAAASVVEGTANGLKGAFEAAPGVGYRHDHSVSLLELIALKVSLLLHY